MIDVKECYFLVYKITNSVNGKSYFGVTKCSIKKRWNEHRHAGRKLKRKTLIANAIHKYGEENFKIELIKSCDTEQEMYLLEINLIKKYRTNNNKFGYNNSIGGEISAKGFRHSEEAKRRLSNLQIGTKRKPHSQQTKDKISAANKLAVYNPDFILKLKERAKLRRGVPLSEKHRQNIRQANANRKGIAIEQILKDNEVIESYISINAAARKTGILQSAISNTLKNKSKTAGGFIWQYR